MPFISMQGRGGSGVEIRLRRPFSIGGGVLQEVKEAAVDQERVDHGA